MVRLRQFFLFPCLLLLLGLLTGCVRYDVGIDFVGQQGGTLIQHITLGDRLTALSETEARRWLDSVVQRAQQLAGRAQKLSAKEVVVSIPFSNGQDLVKKFNQFYHPNTSPTPSTEENLDILQLEATMQMRQSNWLLFERNQLGLDVDLRGLGVLSNQGNIIISPGSLVDIDFSLQTPWGSNNLIPTPEQGEKKALWHLQPGQVNHIETVFWVPSYLGWGTLIIILLTLAGYFLKHGFSSAGLGL